MTEARPPRGRGRPVQPRSPTNPRPGDGRRRSTVCSSTPTTGTAHPKEGRLMTDDAFILDAVRTPIGKHRRCVGGRATRRPRRHRTAGPRSTVTHRSTRPPSTRSTSATRNGAGEDNRNVARMAVLLAGLPTSVPGATVNRLCGSGLEAVSDASRVVAVGDADLVIAGGVESMTRAPWVLPKPARAFPTTHEQMWNTTLGWRMVNPQMPAAWTVALGEGAEILADKYSISRDEQDEFALASHQRRPRRGQPARSTARSSQVAGRRARRATSASAPTAPLESLAKLKPAFREGGTVTAGNSSPMNDGSAALLLASPAGAERAGIEPMARVVSRATSGVEPHLYGIGPVDAARTALQRAASAWGDLDCGRAERGVRRAEPGLPARVARPRPGDRQPAAAARSRSGTRSAARVPASSPRSCTISPRLAGATAWRRCASASARASRSSSRTCAARRAARSLRGRSWCAHDRGRGRSAPRRAAPGR